MTALIATFPPQPDESPVGYMRRLAAANGYRDWKSLVRAAGVNPSANAVHTRGKTLSARLGLMADWPDILKPSKAQPLPDGFFTRNVFDPVCPKCLAEDAHIRRAWSHCLVTVCPRHGNELIDACPACGTVLEPQRYAIERCDCGFELAFASARPADGRALWLAARLQADMRPVAGVPEIGAQADYRRLDRLVHLLCARIEPSRKIKPGKVPRPRSVEESALFLAPLDEILADWPHGFEAHVAHRFAVGDSSHYSLSGRLGEWYLQLFKLCGRGRAFAPLWQAFSDAVFDNFDGALRGQRILTPSEGKRRRYLSVAEAAREIGVSPPTLGVAVSAGKVRAHATRRGAAYTMSFIEREEVERIVRVRAEWVSDGEAAQALGVTEAVLANLVGAGMLEYDPTWRHSFPKPGPVFVASLVPLAERLVANLRGDATQGELLGFNRLTARRTFDKRALSRLYRAIDDGELRPVAHDGTPGLGGLSFNLAEVKEFLGSVALDDALTLPQLERATGWKYESLASWVRDGYLGSETIHLQGRRTSVVPIRELVRFTAEWVPVAQLAHVLKTKPSALTRKLKGSGASVVGYAQTGSGNRRGGLVRLRDIARLAGLHDSTPGEM